MSSPRMIVWSLVLALSLLLGTAVMSPLAVSQRGISADSVSFLSWEFSPGNVYRPNWDYVQRCSGLKERKGARYKDVKWRYSSPHAMPDDIIGLWIPPDTIILDSLYIQTTWLVSHELLHHLMQPGENDPKHPYNPFRVPCMLTTDQNVPPLVWKLREDK